MGGFSNRAALGELKSYYYFAHRLGWDIINWYAGHASPSTSKSRTLVSSERKNVAEDALVASGNLGLGVSRP